MSVASWRRIVLFMLAAFVSVESAPIDPRKEHAGIIETYLTPGNDAVADRLYIEERQMECLERLAADLEAHARAGGARDRETLRRLFRLARVSHAARENHLARGLFPSLVEAARATLPATDPLLPEILVRAGYGARMVGNREEARAFQAEARAAAARLDRSHVNLDFRIDALEEALSPPLRPEARVLRTRAARASQQQHVQGMVLDEAATATWLSVQLDQARQAAEVPAEIARARRILSGIGATEGTYALVLDDLESQIATREGRWGDAVAIAQRASARSEAFRQRSAVGVMSRRGLGVAGTGILALHAVETGQGDAAWRFLEQGRAPHAVDMAVLGAWADTDPASWPTYRAAQTSLLDLRDRAAAVEFGWDDRTWQTTMAWIRARLRVLRLETDYLRGHVPPAPSTDAARRAMGPRDALVGWLEVNLGGDRGIAQGALQVPHRMSRWGYVLRPDRPIAWVKLLSDDASQDVSQVDAGWDISFAILQRAAAWERPVGQDPELARNLRAWSKAFLDPLQPHLRGVERIVFAETQRPVNLHTLPDGAPLDDRFDVAVVPSGQILAMSRPWKTRPPGRRSTATVIYRAEAAGVPLEGVASKRAIRAPLERSDRPDARIPDLPAVQGEVDAVISHFDVVERVTGTPASLHALNGLARSGGLGRFDVVHVAAHTLRSADPESCAFSLSDARGGTPRLNDAVIDAEEILRGWRIAPDLLTLSACDTTLAAGGGPREAWGFLPIAAAIGARRVLSSSFAVDDQATAILMKRFYLRYTDPSSPTPERALREAQRFVRNYRDAAGRQPFRHPIYWSAFHVVELR